MKEWFKARNLWGEAWNALTDEDAGKLVKALWSYTMTGEEPDVDNNLKGYLFMMLLTIKQDEQKEENTSKQRSLAGSKGGNQRVANQANASFASDDQASQANASIENKNKNKNREKEEDKELDKEKEIYKEKEKEVKPEPQKRFNAPTVEEVSAYCKERNNGIDPEYFVAYYTTRNWIMSNGKKMSNWKAAVITWEKNNFSKGSSSSQTKKVNAQQYQQRDYGNKDLEIMQRFLKNEGSETA